MGIVNLYAHAKAILDEGLTLNNNERLAKLLLRYDEVKEKCRKQQEAAAKVAQSSSHLTRATARIQKLYDNELHDLESDIVRVTNRIKSNE